MYEFKTEYYNDSVLRLPKSGQQIIGYQDEHSIVVYQAYKSSIAKFAIENQFLGGPDFSYNRMSWIKPNFLWMMYRCGWAEKENQEAVLAITISKKFFIEILNDAVISSFNSQHFYTQEKWKEALASKEVRLQWDPDHDPFGNKIIRRAIQLGLKGNTLEKFSRKEIQSIRDITPFVKLQKKLVDSGQSDKLIIPYETIVETEDPILNRKIGISLP